VLCFAQSRVTQETLKAERMKQMPASREAVLAAPSPRALPAHSWPGVFTSRGRGR
jgi:hypothetical protein